MRVSIAATAAAAKINSRRVVMVDLPCLTDGRARDIEAPVMSLVHANIRRPCLQNGSINMSRWLGKYAVAATLARLSLPFRPVGSSFARGRRAVWPERP